jgi:hypothetical protein
VTGNATTGRVHRNRASRGLTLLGLLALRAVAAAEAPAVPPPGLAGLLAVEVEYRAHKLIFSSDTRAVLELAPPASALEGLWAAPVGTPVPLPAEAVARLTIETDLPFGRHEMVRLVLDPHNGAALQGEKLVTGRGAERVVSRYLKEGIYVWRAEPADRHEGKLAPDGWTNRREGFSPYPRELPKDAIVTDGYALIPLAEAARLDRPGARLRLYVLAQRRFLRLDFAPEGVAPREVDVEEQTPSSRRLRSGRELVRLVRVSAHGVLAGEAAAADDLRVLGFKGDVTLAVDASNGVPLAITGRADYLGTLTAELVRVRYATDSPTR